MLELIFLVTCWSSRTFSGGFPSSNLTKTVLSQILHNLLNIYGYYILTGSNFDFFSTSISNFFLCISIKIFRALATTSTNNFCSAANLTSPFLQSEDSFLQTAELTNGIDKGQLLGSKHFFFISFDVVWEIREIKLLLIMSVIFSCKGGPISH